MKTGAGCEGRGSEDEGNERSEWKGEDVAEGGGQSADQGGGEGEVGGDYMRLRPLLWLPLWLRLRLPQLLLRPLLSLVLPLTFPLLHVPLALLLLMFLLLHLLWLLRVTARHFSPCSVPPEAAADLAVHAHSSVRYGVGARGGWGGVGGGWGGVYACQTHLPHRRFRCHRHLVPVPTEKRPGDAEPPACRVHREDLGVVLLRHLRLRQHKRLPLSHHHHHHRR